MDSGEKASSSKSRRQSRNNDLSDQEKKELQRKRNIGYLRKSREKVKEEEKSDKQIFEDNEKKIKQLEGMVERLESELSNSSKNSSKSLSKSRSNW